MAKTIEALASFYRSQGMHAPAELLQDAASLIRQNEQNAHTPYHQVPQGPLTRWEKRNLPESQRAYAYDTTKKYEIDELGLDPRVRNALVQAHVTQVDTLIGLDPHELGDIYHIGKDAISAINAKVTEITTPSE